MFRDMRESVYDIYRSIKKCLDQIAGIVGEDDEYDL
jgi:hypothetical protein